MRDFQKSSFQRFDLYLCFLFLFFSDVRELDSVLGVLYNTMGLHHGHRFGVWDFGTGIEIWVLVDSFSLGCWLFDVFAIVLLVYWNYSKELHSTIIWSLYFHYYFPESKHMHVNPSLSAA